MLKRLSAPVIGSICLMVQPLLLNVIGVPAMAYIIRTLGPTAYGQWATATTLIATVAFITNLGLRMQFVRSVALKPDSAPEALAEQLGIRVLLGFSAALAGLVVCAALHYPPVVLQCTLVAGVGLVFTCISSAALDLLQATHRLPAMAGVNMAAGLVLTAASIAVMASGGGPIELSLAYLIGPIISAALGLQVVHRVCCPVRVRWDRRAFGRVLWEARLMAAQLGVATVAAQAEALIVPKLMGMGSYGFFSAGWLMPNRLGIIPDAVATTFFARFADKYQDGAAAVGKEVSRAGLMILVLCIAVAAAVTVVADPIARLLFPANAAACRQVLQITVWWLPFQGLGLVMAFALNATGHDREAMRLSIASNLISLAASAFLISRFGLPGAAWAVIFRSIITAVIHLPCILRVFPLHTAGVLPRSAAETP
ncbi:MAG: Membrane protein involved in the export of O-antigen, teichoic acid lipoteichoic acid [Armatimonadetes bacterium]|jgi:O-antigen/teichoic acid export membrane protein|nr:Membrane protein involved in the export of O-antigen, teichoic acid lipoteichoic acid [Armatimonadota bacterium]